MQVVRAALELPDDKLAGDTFNPQKSGRHPREVDPQAVAGFPTPCLLPHSLGGSEKGRDGRRSISLGGGGGEDETSHGPPSGQPLGSVLSSSLQKILFPMWQR